MAELPGNIHEKIGDLRTERGLTKKQISEDLGIPASQLTRIENQDIKSIGHELIIKFADYFGVSTDYLLGRTNIRFPKNMELNELGLSNKALLLLLSGKINTQLLSRIIEHKNFIPLMDYAEAYFSSAHDAGFLTRNQVIDMAVTDISQFIKTSPNQAASVRKDMRQLNAEKVTGTEADLEKLTSILKKILKDVKNEYTQPQEDITTEQLRNEIQNLHDQELNHYNMGDFTAETLAELTAQMLKPLNMSEENLKTFKELAVNLMEAHDSENK